MKIILVNKYFYIRGGAERVVFLTKQVLEDAGHEVEIFGMKHEKNSIENNYFIDEIDYNALSWWGKIRAGFKSIYNKDAQKKFEKLLHDFKPDVVHFHNIYHQLSFSLFASIKKYHIPSVMTLHDYKMISPNYNLYHHGKIDVSCYGKNYYRCILTNCMESFGQSVFVTIEAYVRRFRKWHTTIDIYISPSNFLKHQFSICGFKKQIDIIENPLDIDKYKKAVQAGEGVVYFGRLSEEKGIRLILHIAQKTPDIRYTIIGDGSLHEMLEQKNISNITCVGYTSGKKLHDILQSARLIIMPSQWYENYPMSIVEAKAMGKVVIASDIGGIAEMLPHDMLCRHDNINAFVKKINEWYKKSDIELITMGKQLKKDVVKTNGLEIYAKKLIQLYERIT